MEMAERQLKNKGGSVSLRGRILAGPIPAHNPDRIREKPGVRPQGWYSLLTQLTRWALGAKARCYPWPHGHSHGLPLACTGIPPSAGPKSSGWDSAASCLHDAQRMADFRAEASDRRSPFLHSRAALAQPASSLLYRSHPSDWLGLHTTSCSRAEVSPPQSLPGSLDLETQVKKPLLPSWPPPASSFKESSMATLGNAGTGPIRLKKPDQVETKRGREKVPNS